MTTTPCTISNKQRARFRGTQILILLAVGLFLTGCAGQASIGARPGYNRSIHMQSFYEVEAQPVGTIMTGEASYYGGDFHGKKTSSGEPFNQNDLTCAHKTLPFQTVLRVTLPQTGNSVEVRVNDRGPYKDGRILDLSKSAAQRLGLIPLGVAEVEAEVVKAP